MTDLEDLEQEILNQLNAPFQRFYFNFWHDWDSLIFWKPMNWRDFRFINLTIETNSFEWFDIEFSLLGFNFVFAIYKRIN